MSPTCRSKFDVGVIQQVFNSFTAFNSSLSEPRFLFVNSRRQIGVVLTFLDPSDQGHELLISYRVYDPDGDLKDVIMEPHGPRDDDSLVPGMYTSFAAQTQELDAMAAAAAPGGLARKQLAAMEVAAVENDFGDVDRVLDVELDLAEPGRRDGNLNGVAAPAADRWSLVGRGHGRDSEGVRGDNVDVDGARGVRRMYRYFGLTSPDEWIPASSGRIEKVNSRAPLRNCWTEEVGSLPQRLSPRREGACGVIVYRIRSHFACVCVCVP